MRRHPGRAPRSRSGAGPERTEATASSSPASCTRRDARRIVSPGRRGEDLGRRRREPHARARGSRSPFVDDAGERRRRGRRALRHRLLRRAAATMRRGDRGAERTRRAGRRGRPARAAWTPRRGRWRAPAVRAAATVTFHAPKVGLVVAPGRFHAGEVEVVDIGLAPGADPPRAASRGDPRARPAPRAARQQVHGGIGARRRRVDREDRRSVASRPRPRSARARGSSPPAPRRPSTSSSSSGCSR